MCCQNHGNHLLKTTIMVYKRVVIVRRHFFGCIFGVKFLCIQTSISMLLKVFNFYNNYFKSYIYDVILCLTVENTLY